MIRKTVAAILLAGMTLSACACTADAHGPKATTVSFAHEFVDPTAETTVLEIETGEFVETVTLKGSGEGETYQFSYDSDILQYTGQGGNFYLCGSTATECYLHIMVQKDDGTLYDSTKESVMGWILKEFKLNSGSRALSYATSEDNIFNILIESEGKLIKVRVGAADKWPYSVEQLANAIDRGFATET